MTLSEFMSHVEAWSHACDTAPGEHPRHNPDEIAPYIDPVEWVPGDVAADAIGSAYLTDLSTLPADLVSQLSQVPSDDHGEPPEHFLSLLVEWVANGGSVDPVAARLHGLADDNGIHPFYVIRASVHAFRAPCRVPELVERIVSRDGAA